MKMKAIVVLCNFLVLVLEVSPHNITDTTFKSFRGVVGAFGDFNSDELTDIFLISNKSRTLQILYGKYDTISNRLSHLISLL